MGAKLRKKLVKAKRFWKINAIRPEIRAKRGSSAKRLSTYERKKDAKNEEVQFGVKSKLGRIGEEVRFLIRNPILIPQTATFCKRWIAQKTVVLQPPIR